MVRYNNVMTVLCGSFMRRPYTFLRRRSQAAAPAANNWLVSSSEASTVNLELHTSHTSLTTQRTAAMATKYNIKAITSRFSVTLAMANGHTSQTMHHADVILGELCSTWHLGTQPTCRFAVTLAMAMPYISPVTRH